MDNSDRKKEDIKFEWLMIGLPFLLIILILIISCGVFYYNNFYSESNQKNIISSYNYILTRFRQDSHQAVVAITATDSVTLLDKNADQLCKYELKNNTLQRYDKKNNVAVIFDNIESLGFTVSDNQPNLLTVRIYPADKKELPFFTSFALRGLNNDMQ
jgi:energy-coupling factor transporter transmembrane protein EcfT